MTQHRDGCNFRELVIQIQAINLYICLILVRNIRWRKTAVLFSKLASPSERLLSTTHWTTRGMDLQTFWKNGRLERILERVSARWRISIHTICMWYGADSRRTWWIFLFICPFPVCLRNFFFPFRGKEKFPFPFLSMSYHVSQFYLTLTWFNHLGYQYSKNCVTIKLLWNGSKNSRWFQKNITSNKHPLL